MATRASASVLGFRDKHVRDAIAFTVRERTVTPAIAAFAPAATGGTTTEPRDVQSRRRITGMRRRVEHRTMAWLA
jgi:hypothetical protein